jgi:RNA polymerase sigma factor (sigma-70 family)
MASVDTAQQLADAEQSFDLLYRSYARDVHRSALRLLHNAADAEDTVQIVFLNALRAMRQGVQPDQPRAWLLAITRNVCRGFFRAQAARPRERELDPTLALVDSDYDGPSSGDIVSALGRLLPDQQTALVLREFRGMPRAEIAGTLGLSPSAVEALLARAKATLREELAAAEEPLHCTKAEVLVRCQLERTITRKDRRALRAHLRGCAGCSQHARAMRASRRTGRTTGLLWPWGLVRRLASLFATGGGVAKVVAPVATVMLVGGLAPRSEIVPRTSSQHGFPQLSASSLDVARGGVGKAPTPLSTPQRHHAYGGKGALLEAGQKQSRTSDAATHEASLPAAVMTRPEEPRPAESSTEPTPSPAQGPFAGTERSVSAPSEPPTSASSRGTEPRLAQPTSEPVVPPASLPAPAPAPDPDPGPVEAPPDPNPVAALPDPGIAVPTVPSLPPISAPDLPPAPALPAPDLPPAPALPAPDLPPAPALPAPDLPPAPASLPQLPELPPAPLPSPPGP